MGHVIILFQENRPTDNLFHDSVLKQRGADIADYGMNSLGQKIKLTGVPLASNYDLYHSRMDFIHMYDNGKMDGANKIMPTCNPGAPNCPPANPQFKYVYPSDVQPYFQLAEQYTFADRMFATPQSPSYPAHQFIVSGTSAPAADSSWFVYTNGFGVPEPNGHIGCTAPSGEYVKIMDAHGQEVATDYPCFEHQALSDLLDNAGLTWAYYTPEGQKNSIWNGFDIIQHIRLGPDWKNIVVNPTQILSDLQNGQLRAVSWVIPRGQSSDHAGTNDGTGPSWIASVVNAVGKSPYWNDTAIFITWDEWGGWYDHVAPTVIDDGVSWGSGFVYGFRVPLIVVSPFAKPAYISHVTHDFGSILRFIEENFSLPSLGYADYYADDLSDCFNFSGKARKFKTIQAPLGADYFLNDKRPATAPDND